MRRQRPSGSTTRPASTWRPSITEMRRPRTIRTRTPSASRTATRSRSRWNLPRLPSFNLPAWLAPWLLVTPLTAILFAFFALPTLLFLVVSFFDHDRMGIYPDFLLDSYRDLITNPATLRIYGSTLKFAAI